MAAVDTVDDSDLVSGRSLDLEAHGRVEIAPALEVLRKAGAPGAEQVVIDRTSGVEREKPAQPLLAHAHPFDANGGLRAASDSRHQRDLVDGWPVFGGLGSDFGLPVALRLKVLPQAPDAALDAVAPEDRIPLPARDRAELLLVQKGPLACHQKCPDAGPPPAGHREVDVNLLSLWVTHECVVDCGLPEAIVNEYFAQRADRLAQLLVGKDRAEPQLGGVDQLAGGRRPLDTLHADISHKPCRHGQECQSCAVFSTRGVSDDVAVSTGSEKGLERFAQRSPFERLANAHAEQLLGRCARFDGERGIEGDPRNRSAEIIPGGTRHRQQDVES